MKVVVSWILILILMTMSGPLRAMTPHSSAAFSEVNSSSPNGPISLVLPRFRKIPTAWIVFSYNYNDQIKRVTGSAAVSYVYDGSGNRVSKQFDSGAKTDYLWNGSEVLKEYNGDGSVKAQYLMGLGREGIKTGGKWSFYLNDAIGSTYQLVDATGNLQGQWSYDDWGNSTTISKTAATAYNPYLFQGQQFDGETGLYSMRARYYDPKTARFTSPDPIRLSGGRNMYTAFGGDPIGRTDPSGLDTLAPGYQYGPHGVEEIPGYDWDALNVRTERAYHVARGAMWVGGIFNRGIAILDMGISAVEGGQRDPTAPILLGVPEMASGGTSGGRPAVEGDDYSPAVVEERSPTRPQYRTNPKHNPLAPHRGASPEPSDALSVYENNSIPQSKKTWWGKGSEGFYRFSSDNAGGAHYSGTFPPNSPLVPNWIKRMHP